MKIEWVTRRPSNSSLLILFAGWGMDTHPFADYVFDGYDFAVAYDYAAPSQLLDLSGYSEICVAAWSFGVVNAANFIAAHPELPITLRVAINGTTEPVSDTHGIPASVYNATLQGLSERSLEKFNLRMCGSREAYARYGERRPQRSMESLRCELQLMAEASAPESITWDYVYVADDDRIIPTANQLAAWAGHPGLRPVEGSHMPDLYSLISSHLSDKRMVAHNFGLVRDTYDMNATVQREVAARLAAILPELPEQAGILEFGVGTGLFTRELMTRYPHAMFRLWDLAVQQPRVEQCDAETAIINVPDASFDLITGASAIQWFHSPATFLQRCRRKLRRGGQMLFSTFAPGTCAEVTDITGHGLNYPGADEWRSMAVNAGFSVSEIVEWKTALMFDTPAQVLRHMSLTGVNSVDSPERSVTQALRVLKEYPVDKATGHCPLTYRPLVVSLKVDGDAAQ